MKRYTNEIMNAKLLVQPKEGAAGDGREIIYICITAEPLSLEARVSIIAEIFTLDYISNKRQWR